MKGKCPAKSHQHRSMHLPFCYVSSCRRLQHPSSRIQHPTSNIQHPTSDIQHPITQHPASNNRPTGMKSSVNIRTVSHYTLPTADVVFAEPAPHTHTGSCQRCPVTRRNGGSAHYDGGAIRVPDPAERFVSFCSV
jgi:hypothetical protein